MGNIIGIKLADGSFYPVMEEGKPFSKKLELTTVRDGQTTVHLDLYRSATGSMDDAEYVDTLVVENLVPHPKQEHSLNLNIKLDENNMLSAEIDDPETGAISNSKVSLVTLKKEDLAAEPDYSITPEENIENFDEIDEIIDENIIDNLDDFEESDKLPEEIDIEVPSNFSDSEPTFLGENPNSEEDFLVEDDTSDLNNDFVFPEEIENLEESDNFDTKDAMILGGVGAAAVAGAVLADNLSTTEEIPTIEEDVIEEPQSFQEDSQLEEIDILVPEETSESAEMDDFALPSADTEISSESAELDDFAFPSADTEETSESTVLDDFAFPSADTEETSESAELDDFAFPSADTEVSSESAELDDFAFPSADTEISSESAVLDDFAFPSADTEVSSESAEMDDFAFPSADTEISSESAVLNDFAFPSADTEASSESAVLEDSAFSVADSELPNFDDFDIDSEESFEMEDNAPFTFDSLPEFDEIPELKDNSTDFSDDFAAMDFELPEIDESKYEFAASNEGGDPLFDSLYEENYKETEKSQKKTTIPVVICVICALICLGVLGIILWLTKPNLFGKKDAEPTVTIPVENVETELPVLEKEDLTSAKENEIVITPEPVVPEIPEPKVEVAPAKVIYRIKWGDTLWDLAESYYQNPWLYPKIAKANNIKNPDVIISGTDIEIPPLN